MKYFADYMKEHVYAIDEKTGKGLIKNERGTFNIRVDTKNIPWLSEENGIGFLVEEMTKEEFDNYGKKWEWAKSPSSAEIKKHSWRNFMENINS